MVAMSDRIELVCIYGLRCPCDGLFHYVGATQNPEMRLIGHWSDRYNHTGAKGDWLRELHFKNRRPSLEILEKVTDPERLSAEARWIQRLFNEGHPICNHPVIADAHQWTRCYFDPDQAAKALGKSRQYVLAAIRSGRLKAEWISGRFIVNILLLEAYRREYLSKPEALKARPIEKERAPTLRERIAELERRMALLEAARPQQGEAR